MTKIKLCGNFRLIDAEYLNQVHPDLAGLILVPERRRTVTNEFAQRFRANLDATIPLVGVFKNPTIAEIRAVGNAIQIVQLHGTVSQALVDAVHELGLQVIQVHSLIAPPCMTDAEYHLFDNSEGTGQVLDTVGFKLPLGANIGIAGGLKPDNLQAMLARFKPGFVDISSGSETNGTKDLAKMQTLVTLAHNTEEDKN